GLHDRVDRLAPLVARLAAVVAELAQARAHERDREEDREERERKAGEREVPTRSDEAVLQARPVGGEEGEEQGEGREAGDRDVSALRVVRERRALLHPLPGLLRDDGLVLGGALQELGELVDDDTLVGDLGLALVVDEEARHLLLGARVAP